LPIAYKKRKLGEEKRKKARENVKKLISVGFIQEARYTTLLTNVVMVKKANGKWRMCIGYTNLKNVCPKHAYPLPSINQLVEVATCHKILIFLNAYLGYNQIQINKNAFEA